MTCPAHPFGTDHGATCVLPVGQPHGHRYESAWLADRHTTEVNDD